MTAYLPVCIFAGVLASRVRLFDNSQVLQQSMNKNRGRQIGPVILHQFCARYALNGCSLLSGTEMISDMTSLLLGRAFSSVVGGRKVEYD